MEANIEEPMGLDELSRHVGLSRRQVERLFKAHLGCVPTRYYMRLRLETARRLMLQTNLPALDIALACGFVSAPHFTKCYRSVYGLPPVRNADDGVRSPGPAKQQSWTTGSVRRHKTRDQPGRRENGWGRGIRTPTPP